MKTQQNPNSKTCENSWRFLAKVGPSPSRLKTRQRCPAGAFLVKDVVFFNLVIFKSAFFNGGSAASSQEGSIDSHLFLFRDSSTPIFSSKEVKIATTQNYPEWNFGDQYCKGSTLVFGRRKCNIDNIATLLGTNISPQK